MAIVYLLLISSCCLLQWSGAFTPVVYNAKVLPSSQCDQSDPFEDNQQLMEALKMAQKQLPPPECNPSTTCSDILRSNPQATTRWRLPIARSTVTWRGPTVEEREAG